MLEMLLIRILKKPVAPGDESGNEQGLEIDPEVFEKLMASDGAANDFFGYSVAISSDGSTIVVGTPNDDDKGSNSGSVYIFTKQANGSYLQFQKLVADDGAAGDYFGWSVAISGDSSTIVVGSPNDDDKGSNSGSAYIFIKQANGSYLETQNLVASDGAASDYFGKPVTISGDGSTIVVGAYQDDDKGSDSGSVYIFTKQANGSYFQFQKLVADDGAAGDNFGHSVAISGDSSTIVVGSPNDDLRGSNSGSAYIFTKQANGSYLQFQKLVPSDRAAGDYFGWSVAISGDSSTIVVGAYQDDDKGSNSGSVYIFTKQANGSYLQFQKLVADDGATSDLFGYSVTTSSDGSTIVVGAYQNDDKGSNSGSVYIFTKQANGSYLQTQNLVPADGAANDFFGWSVTTSQTSVVIGAYNHLGKGTVYVY